jgi:AraC family transcriptional regulator
MAQTNLVPSILRASVVPGGRLELVEWHWPAMIDFTQAQSELMVEMSLPPLAADGSACFPDIDPAKRCFLGSLFVRWPGVKVSGRSEGGHIRVMRCVFSADAASRIVAGRPLPELAFLQSLLAIRSEALRSLMRLAHRELTNPADPSPTANAALVELISIEVRRLVERGTTGVSGSRLAAWQFRRIRERIESSAGVPNITELATICGISARHLHRQFLALTGKTVADYIEAARIEKAKRRLALDHEPIKAIAEACGFAHANSFARAFRRSTGFSPQGFRQQSITAGTRETTH